MAIPWLSLLSNIPWGQVVDGAPKVADAAGKLWNKVSETRKARQPEDEPAAAQATAAPPSGANAAAADRPTAGSSAGSSADAADPSLTQADLDPLRQELQRLSTCLQALERRQADAEARLQAELRDSSALIKALADQNATLVAQVQLAQRRLKALSWATALGALVLAGGLAALAVMLRG